MTFKDKYKEELGNISFGSDFEKDTVALLKNAAQRKENIMSTNRKPIKIAVMVAAVIMLLSFSVSAIISLLSPSQVADHFGEKELAVFFEENTGEVQTVTDGYYCVSFLGMAPGKELCIVDGAKINENRSYAVWALYRNDGTPLSILDGSPIQVIPVMKGYRPNTLFSFGMSAHGTEKDGVLYFLCDYTDLEVFADKEVSLIVFEGTFPTLKILTNNENGDVVYSDSYEGIKGSFTLKLDKTKADNEAAEKLLKSVR